MAIIGFLVMGGRDDLAGGLAVDAAVVVPSCFGLIRVEVAALSSPLQKCLK